jgi:hypothetical protein
VTFLIATLIVATSAMLVAHFVAAIVARNKPRRTFQS